MNPYEGRQSRVSRAALQKFFNGANAIFGRVEDRNHLSDFLRRVVLPSVRESQGPLA
jgi:hypothetical protein